MSSDVTTNTKGNVVSFVLYIIVLLVVFGAATFFVIRRIDQGYEPGLDKIKSKIERQEYESALKMLQQVDDTAKQIRMQKMFLRGKVMLYKAIEKQNRDDWKRYGTNESNWLDCREGKRAEYLLKKVLEMDPAYGPACYYLGMLYMQRGWYSEAITWFRKAIERKSHVLYSYINMGVIYSRQEKVQQAKKMLLNAWKLDTTSTDVAKNVYFLYSHYIPKPESAIVWGNRYLNLDPEHDLQEYMIKREMADLLARYPEMKSKLSIGWKKKSRFDTVRMYKSN